MSMNVQLLQTLMQLQAMKAMNDSSPSDPIAGSDSGDSFSSLLTALLAGDSLDTNDLTDPSSASPVDPQSLLGASGNGLDILALTPSAQTQAAPSDFDSYINEAAATYQVDPGLIRAVIQNESGFDPTSISSTGAIGLMQLMPGTARSLGVTDPFDPKANIDGGTKYLKQLLDTFGNNKALAVAAYNAGPGNVQKYNGIPPFSETQNYVRKVLGTYLG